ncbi:Ase1p [Sporobolomyces salmoneus]|uniref:Ase1p n=1 Tax=Sporobolomyces salmoneus TaxID=183962 RepID=UPI00316EB75E
MTSPTSLSSLITSHEAHLTTLYSNLTLDPSPLIASQLSLLESLVSSEISKQTTEINLLLEREREKLEQGWSKVNDWLTALGEPIDTSRREREKEGGVLQEMVREVEGVLEGMRSRISERGERIVKVQKELYEVRATLGEEKEKVKLDDREKLEKERGWEDMDLKRERLEELEIELQRCKTEIVRRRELLDRVTTEIATLVHELGTRVQKENQQEEEALLEKVALHLGTSGSGRQEMTPSLENVEKLERLRLALEQEQTARHEKIQSTYDQLYHLWTMLGVPEQEMDFFVNQWTGSTLEVIAAYQTELDRMLTLRRTNLSSFINAERQALTSLYDQLYLSHSERIARFPSLTISIDPETVWRDEDGGYEEELVNENVREELLMRHEREREKAEVEVEDARQVLEKLERYFEVVQKGKDLEAAAADPSRLTMRGSSTKLLIEERDRKRVAKEKPKLEAELRELIPVWESKHRRPFLVDGVPFLDSLDQQQRAEEMEKENKRRTKLGTTASTTRPLRAQPTGTSTVAPLKRQMTGTSTRSNTSSNSGQPPPAKRQVPMTTGSSTHSSSTYSQPRPRSVLGDSHNFGSGGRSVMATPASTKPQGTRSRANTVSKMVTPTPTGGSGMRLPTGWGTGAMGGVGLQPQMTGTGTRAMTTGLTPAAQRFRPRPSTTHR